MEKVQFRKKLLEIFIIIDLEELICNIRYNKYDETLLKRYSKNIQNLVCLMLQKRREDRIKIEDILKIDFIYVTHDF